MEKRPGGFDGESLSFALTHGSVQGARGNVSSYRDQYRDTISYIAGSAIGLVGLGLRVGRSLPGFIWWRAGLAYSMHHLLGAPAFANRQGLPAFGNDGLQSDPIPGIRERYRTIGERKSVP